MKKLLFLDKLLLASIVSVAPLHASAASFQFSYTFDGTSASLDAGSAFPTASSLQPGDNFVLTVMASDNDYWKVTSPLPSSVYASYLTLPNVTRTFNSIETLFLDGLTVNTRTRAGDNQAAAHFGGDTNGPASLFTVGQKFDKYVLNYTLLDDEGTSTKAESDQLGWDPFYNRPTEITYFKSSSASVPGPLSLLGLGTAFAYSRKLRRTIKGHRTSSVHSFPTRQL